MVTRARRQAVGAVLAVPEPHARSKYRQGESDTARRTITSAEVIGWFENCRKPRPNEAICKEIAGRLTKMRWPSDPPLPALKDGEHWERSIDWNASPPKVGEWRSEPDTDADQWWDFQAASDAAKLLLASVPRMLRHWEGLQWAPETRDGYKAIKALEDALSAAQPYIEWPFGKYKRQDYRERPRPKNWHLLAVLIANIIVKALIQSGHRAPGLASNSIVVRVVCKALARMGYPDINMVTHSAVGAYLTRRAAEHGKFGITT